MTRSTEEVRDLTGTELASTPLHYQAPMLNTKQTSDSESKRRKLVALLRGYFASPVIAALGETGVAEKMLGGDFSMADLNLADDQTVVAAVLRYLHGIGLLTNGNAGDYALTPEGRTAFTRNGAFSLLMSYAEYFHELPALLTGEQARPSVNRLRNVRGSGQLHSKKFFPVAFDFFSLGHPTAVIDIGCGDGRFLGLARERWPGVATFGVDLSETAVASTIRRLGSSVFSEPAAVVANGKDVATWSKAVPRSIVTSSYLILSLWFVCHEFSNESPERIIEFFTTLHEVFPRGQVLLGEINKISPEILHGDHDLSIVPEFLLFHALSGQGVLSWEIWQDILANIPYSLKEERRFDEVHPAVGEPIPASFVWLLEPK